MELKQLDAEQEKISNELLIVPYGIETRQPEFITCIHLNF